MMVDSEEMAAEVVVVEGIPIFSKRADGGKSPSDNESSFSQQLRRRITGSLSTDLQGECRLGVSQESRSEIARRAKIKQVARLATRNGEF